MSQNFMYDKQFLLELDQQTNKEVYAKIIALTFEEQPVEEITGKVTSGSISIDGTSAVRRTCSLSLVAQDVNLTDFYWGLNTKFKLCIGVKNTINSQYDDIIWFNQGIYLIDSFSTSYSNSGFSISLSGKDKMCLLNGEIGGSIPSLTHVFDSKELVDAEGGITIEKYSLWNIIRDAVHAFAKEPFSNIIINDLDISGLELMEYRGTEDMLVLFAAEDDNTIKNIMFVDNVIGTFFDENNKRIDITDGEAIVYNYKLDIFTDQLFSPTVVHNNMNGDRYTIGRITSGQACGYRVTELTYAGDLIGNLGQSITSAVLDPIVSMLGDYEYFYDLDGRFVFQKKHSYIKDIWHNISLNTSEADRTADSAAYTSALSYSFDDNALIQSISNSPDLTNIRNDYSLWGTRIVMDDEYPIHLRYAIDEKPLYYKNYDNQVYISFECNQYIKEGRNCLDFSLLDMNSPKIVDWRELIYQMSLDYLKHNHDDDFEIQIVKNNSFLYPNGKTGYELYYTDVHGFWRELYNPDLATFMVKGEKPNSNLSALYEWDAETNTYVSFDFSEFTSIQPITEKTPKVSYLDSTSPTGYSEYIYDIQKTKNFYKLTELSQVRTAKSNSVYYVFNGVNYVKTDITNTGFIPSYSYYLNKGYEQVQMFGPLAKTTTYYRKIGSDYVEAFTIYGKIKYYKDIERTALANLFSFGNTYYGENGTEITLERGTPYYTHKGFTLAVDLSFCKTSDYFQDTAISLNGYDGQSNMTLMPGRNYICYYKIPNADVDNGDYYMVKESVSNEHTLVKMKLEKVLKTFKQGQEYYIYENYYEKVPLPYQFNKGETYYQLHHYDFIPCENLTELDPFKTYYINKAGWHEYNYHLFKDDFTNRPFYDVNDYNPNTGWTMKLYTPELLNFWFDFLDTSNSSLAQYSAKAIGNRPYYENNDDIKAIYYRLVPNILFVTENNPVQPFEQTGYSHIQLNSSYEQYFTISAQKKSTFDALQNLLSVHTHGAETINLSTIPVYYLEPNTRIVVQNKDNSINGEYIITSLNIPLGANGTMSINAYKALKQIY